MDKENRIQRVNSTLKKVNSLSVSDIEAAREMAKKQADYAHPLKQKTQGQFNDKGKKNLLILQKLEELRSAINSHQS